MRAHSTDGRLVPAFAGALPLPDVTASKALRAYRVLTAVLACVMLDK